MGCFCLLLLDAEFICPVLCFIYLCGFIELDCLIVQFLLSLFLELISCFGWRFYLQNITLCIISKKKNP